MGVHGLWRLIEPSGKPVPLETLENKVLAVDISIWLHQAVKGFQDSKGAPVPNAHLLGVYHRVCKLLYFKIKPVFVFDGGVPALKRETIAKRNQLKSRNSTEADRLQKQLLSTLLKHTAISKVLSEKTKASITAQTKKAPKHENLYILPSSEEMDSTISSSEEEDETEDSVSDSPTKQWDLHTIDPNSTQFKSLPLEVRHEILTELKETRKQSSWGRLHELPKQSDDFSSYQMNRLLKRQSVQAALDEAAQEMGGSSLSLAELESLLKDKGVPTALNENVGKRIASDENTRYLYIKDVKEALAKAREKEEKKDEADTEEGISTTKADLEEEEELQRAIALSLQEVPSTSNSTDNNRELEISYLDSFKDGDFVSDDSDEDFVVPEIPPKKKFSSAQGYMMEYSGLTPNEIERIIEDKGKQPLKQVGRNIKIIRKNREVDVKTSPIQIELDNPDKLKIHNSKNGEVNDNDLENKDSRVLKNVQVTTENIYGTNGNKIELEDIKEKSSDKISDSVNRINELNQCVLSSVLKSNTNEADEGDTEKVEVMSDSGDSTSSEDFIEIANNSQMHESSIIKDNSTEEDIFSDIFENKNDIEKLDSILLGVSKQESKLGDENKTVNLETLDKDEIENPKNKNDKYENNVQMVNKELETTINNIEVENQSKDNKIEVVTINNEGSKTETENLSNSGNSEEFKRPELSLEEMQVMQNDLLQEKTDLLIEKSIKERMAVSITDQMYKEAQELLELFGVPYIIAPMEAEAQCAYLDEIELTDGTITDDSDIWLFGGRKVYKNFFNQSKYVLEFQAENIKHNFKLTREQMILLALLVGSDYTIGIHGIGPVTALEILAAFPVTSEELTLTNQQLISGLREFKSWFHKGQSGGPGKSNLKSKLKNITFTDHFPSFQVAQAYLEPKVDTSKENFSWDKPDFVSLSLFAREKFGWSAKKTDDILNPVIKRLEESRMQKSIKDYFKTKFKIDSGELDNKVSKRVKTAINRMGKTQEELIAEEMEILNKEKQKITKRKTESRSKLKRKNTNTISNDNNSNSLQVKTDIQDVESKTTSQKVARKKKEADEPQEKKPKKTKTTAGKTSTHKKKANIKSNEESGYENIEQISQSSEYFEPTKAKETCKKKTSDKTENQKPKVKIQRDLTRNIGSLPNSNTSSEEELKLYENVAKELKMRRQRKMELAKIKQDEAKAQKQKKELPKKLEAIPEELKDDEEVQFLIATTSRSSQRTEEIKKEVKKELDKEQHKKQLPNLHTKEVIHQRLRDRSNVLRNRIKAIEVFRKSKKGPGYVPKRQKVKRAPKEDAKLSEESSDE